MLLLRPTVELAAFSALLIHTAWFLNCLVARGWWKHLEKAIFKCLISQGGFSSWYLCSTGSVGDVWDT